MGSYAGIAAQVELEPTLRVVDAGVTLRLTQEEAHELFERVLSSSMDDTPASAEALRKLASAIDGGS